MSINTMKKKSIRYPRWGEPISGRMPNQEMVIRRGALSTGGGFSLNGPTRNIGRVGQNHLFSSGGSKMKAGTSDLKGWGGCCGNYIGKEENQTWKRTECCISQIGSKPSVINTKGMLANRYRWKKTTIPDEVFTDAGLEVPDKHQLQNIYNRWTTTDNTGYVEKKTLGIYTENLGNVTQTCPNAQIKTNSGIKGCPAATDGGGGQKPHHIGGRFVSCKPYAKFLHPVGDGSDAVARAKMRRANVMPKGYDKPYPYAVPPADCAVNSTQASDPNVLRSYYSAGNNTNPVCGDIDNN